MKNTKQKKYEKKPPRPSLKRQVLRERMMEAWVSRRIEERRESKR